MANGPSEQRALKHYITTQLQAQMATIIAGTRWTNLACYAQRPKIQIFGENVLIAVGNVRRRTKRIGMGRPAGLKRHEYEVELLIQAQDVDDQGGGDDFDQISDQVETAIETIPLQATITDPLDNAAQFLVTSLGEEIESHTVDPVMLEDLQMVEFTANKVFPVWISYND